MAGRTNRLWLCKFVCCLKTPTNVESLTGIVGLKMKPISKYKNDYLLAWEETTDKFFLLFHTIYNNQLESICIQLPLNISSKYIKEGHKNLVSWIKRIDEDYQVGRFSKDNPRLMTEYILATDEQKEALTKCFNNNICLIEQEAIRLLYLLGDANGKIYYEMTQGKNIPIEIFCLAFHFYDREKPLLDHAGNQLLDKANATSALQILEKSPVYGCPDAALMLLGELTRQKDSTTRVIHLNCLQPIANEPNCRYIHSNLKHYLEQAENFNYVNIKDPQSGYDKVIQEFETEFPQWPNFSLNKTQTVDHWSFMESTLAWEHEYLDCLIEAFANQDISINKLIADDLLCLLNGRDRNLKGYSTGQAIKYCNQDPAYFTQETVTKPHFPATGKEDFIVAVWKQYLHLFANTDYSSIKLNAVLDEFVLNWNRD
jgi:hypothetical protein